MSVTTHRHAFALALMCSMGLLLAVVATSGEPGARDSRHDPSAVPAAELSTVELPPVSSGRAEGSRGREPSEQVATHVKEKIGGESLTLPQEKLHASYSSVARYGAKIAWCDPKRTIAIAAGRSVLILGPTMNEPRVLAVVDPGDVAWSHDGRLLAMTGHGVSIIDPRFGAVVQEHRLHGMGIGRPQWHPDELLVATVSDDRTVIWDVRSNSAAAILENSGHATGVHWSPDGSELAIERFAGLSLYDLHRGRIRLKLDLDGTVGGAAWSPDGGSISANFGVSDELVRWNTKRGSYTRLPGMGRQWIRYFEQHSDGRHLAMISGISNEAGDSDEGLLFWDLETQQIIDQWPMRPSTNSSVLKWHPTEPVLAVANSREKVTLYDISTREVVARIPVLIVEGMRWRPDGRILAVESYDGSVLFWDYSRKMAIARLYFFDEGLEWAVILPGKRYFATPGVRSKIEDSFPGLVFDRRRAMLALRSLLAEWRPRHKKAGK